MGGGERLGEREGDARGCEIVCVCVRVRVCVCACVWMQERGRDSVRYVMRYSVRQCIVVMFHV